MSDRVRLIAGLGAVVLLVGAVLMLRQGDPPETTKGRPEARSKVEQTRPTDARPVTTRRLAEGSPDDATPDDATPDDATPDDATPVPAAGPLDRTGEPASNGPAQPLELPPRDEAELGNAPSSAEVDEVTDRVLERLTEEIAQAKAAGDTETAQRLEVRKARLERRRATRDDDEVEGEALTTG